MTNREGFSKLSDENDDILSLGLELSDKEIHHIGSIIAKWGALEHEIFIQTLLTFETQAGEKVDLPKEMHNLQFTKVLDLWKERVVEKAEGEKIQILTKQYNLISDIKKYRDALVHGMWEWSKDDVTRISAIRIRKKEIITVHFTASDLEHLDLALGKINFKVTYPGGPEDMAESMSGEFSYMSRRFLAEVTKSDIANDWLGKPIAIDIDPENDDDNRA